MTLEVLYNVYTTYILFHTNLPWLYKLLVRVEHFV